MTMMTRVALGMVVALGGLTAVLTTSVAHAAGVVTECTQSALEAAIADGGMVTIDCGGTEIPINGSLMLARVEVTIDGATPDGPVTLRANTDPTVDPARVMEIAASATVTLRNLVIADGRDRDGAGIKNFGRLTLQGVIVRDNVAETVGAGIENFGSLTVTDSVIVGNRIDNVGGGLFNTGTAQLTRVAIIDNTAGLLGGGINSEGRLTLTNATVAGNQAGNDGGGVRLHGSSSSGSTVRHVTITDNTLTSPSIGAGAGLRVDGDGFVTLRNSLIAGNTGAAACSLAGSADVGVGNRAGDDSCGADVASSDEAINLGARTVVTVAGAPDQSVHNPVPPSTAINAGDPAACNDPQVADVDQVGTQRPLSDACDAGAIELDVTVPVVDLNGAAAGRDTSAMFAENDAPVTLAADVTVASGETDALQRATARIVNVGDTTAESLDVDVGATGLTASYEADTATLTLTGPGAPAAFASALATLRYGYAGAIIDDAPRRVQVVVDDGRLSSTPSVATVALSAINDVPVAVDDAFATAADTVLEQPAPGVLDNDSDADNDILTATGPSVSAGGASVTVTADGSLRYDPTQAYASLAADTTATDRFDYRVTDPDGASATARVSVTVTGINDPPVANDDAFALSEDAALTRDAPGVLANDSDVDTGDTLTIADADATTSGGLAVTIATDGRVELDATDNPEVQGLRGGEQRIETAAYTVRDASGAQATATVTFTITGVNDAPTAGALPDLSVFTGEAIALDTATVFSDRDTGDTLRWFAGGLPTGLAIDPATGVISGTPGNDATGRYSITVVARDQAGAEAAAPFLLTVQDRGNDAPFLVNPIADQTAAEGQAVALDLTDVFADPEDEPVSFAADGLPDGLTVEDTVITGTVAIRSVGDYAVTVTATDINGAATTDRFTFTVTEPERDLSLDLTSAATLTAPKTSVMVTANIANAGVSLTPAMVTLRISGVGLDVPVPADCVRSTAVDAVVLDCDAGTVAGGETATLPVSVAADRSGDVVVQARAGNPASDLTPDNNTGMVSVTVVERLAEQPGVVIPITGATRVAVLDRDADGDLDLAIGTDAGRATRLFDQVDSDTFEPAGSLGDVGQTRGLVAGDFDGRAGTDLLVANAAGGHAVFVNTGEGVFVLAPDAVGDAEAIDALAADLDDDGAPDALIVHADAQSLALFSDGEDGFDTRLLETPSALSAALTDVDADGRPDPVFGVGDGDVFQPTIGARGFASRRALPSVGASAMVGGDFDGDGAGDVLVAVPATTGETLSPSTVSVLRADGGLELVTGARADLSTPRRMRVGDVDDDGDMDAVVANPNGVVQLLINDGAGRLRPHDEAIGVAAIDLALADMDGDGDDDLVIVRADAAQVEIWFAQGDLRYAETPGTPVSQLHDDDEAGALMPAWLLVLLAGLLIRHRRAGRRGVRLIR